MTSAAQNEDYDMLNATPEREQDEPWYRDRANTHPFPDKPVRKISQQNDNAPAFRSLAMFPWNKDSLQVLWRGDLHTEEYAEGWKKMVDEYWDAVAVASDYNLYIFFTHQKKAPICVKLPPDDQKLIDADQMCVAWGLGVNAPLEPLIMFSRGSLLYVYSIVRMGIAGHGRGHGGAITCIAVHPTRPNLFCTTSRDYTTRVYDLNLEVVDTDKRTRSGKKKRVDKFKNPTWPPAKGPSLAGAAHGLHLPLRKDEGNGLGRCVAVMMGGRSGGHNAAVLGAAFHPSYDLLATCGMDRCVKIWLLRREKLPLELKREDKPIFSSSRIHKARVLSVSWLQEDLLLTYSAPALMRHYPYSDRKKSTYLEPGELVVWRWLGLDRYCKVVPEDVKPEVFRGVSSDYQESSSFKLISIHSFPGVSSQYHVPKLSLFESQPRDPEQVFKSRTHDPVVLFVYPGARELKMLNLCHLSPKKAPPFPVDFLEKVRKERERANGGSEDGTPSEEIIDDEPVVNGRAEVGTPPPLEGWSIGLRDEADEEKAFMNCAMGVGGRVIVGVGTKGSLWVWRYDP